MHTEILCGDNLPILREMADNSVDAIVTDPPYGLSFMGKRWDYDVPSVELWAECLRVLKPGGHLLAFAGTRTQHRMAVRIEDAGFEIRDMIAWVYGSGFPKSLDIGKAIDKGHGENRKRQLQFTSWMRSTGITAEQINEATGSCMASHYLTDKSQPAIATADMFDKLRPHLPEVPEEIERLVCERTGLEWTAYQQREVVGVQTRYNEPSGIVSAGRDERTLIERKLTTPATDAAKQWDGWGTALKPALEPITLARKPLAERTVAANVLEWGTGGVNVDGCRVGTDDNLNGGGYSGGTSKTMFNGLGRLQPTDFVQPPGRFPANLIHDGSDEVVGLFPVTGPSKAVKGARAGKSAGRLGAFSGQAAVIMGHDDQGGSAARFFYCAKASRSEREAGLEGIEPRLAGCMNMRNDNHAQQNGLTFAPKSNHHPTVKPIALMRYLCRLVTPPGGIVLDPFTGSGTTGCAATLEGFGFIGIEREAEYAEIARRRIEHWRDAASQDETIIEDVQEKLFAEMV